MNEDVLGRIKQLIEADGISVTAFARKIGLGQSTVNAYINGDRKISLNFVFSILNAYPNLSTDWIMKGEGQMYKQPVMVDDHMTTTIPQALLEAELQKMKESLKAELMAEIKKA